MYINDNYDNIIMTIGLQYNDLRKMKIEFRQYNNNNITITILYNDIIIMTIIIYNNDNIG